MAEHAITSHELHSPFSIHVAETESERKMVRALLGEYTSHLHTFLHPATLAHRSKELFEISPAFLPPTGAYLLALRDGRASGCVGVRSAGLAGESAAEICRLFVTSVARGLSLGELLLQEALAAARRFGYDAAVLYPIEGHMEAAKKLYLRALAFNRSPPTNKC